MAKTSNKYANDSILDFNYEETLRKLLSIILLEI